jgi:hypothetical protein
MENIPPEKENTIHDLRSALELLQRTPVNMLKPASKSIRRRSCPGFIAMWARAAPASVRRVKTAR